MLKLFDCKKFHLVQSVPDLCVLCSSQTNDSKLVLPISCYFMLPKEKLTKTFKSKDWLERLVYSMLKRRKMEKKVKKMFNLSTTFTSYLYYRHAKNSRDYGKSIKWPEPSVHTRHIVPSLRILFDRWRAAMILSPFPRSEWPQLRLKVCSS